MRVRSRTLLVGLFAAVTFGAQAMEEPTLPLAQIAGVEAVPAQVSIDDPVTIRDFLAQFQVRSGAASYTAEGVQMLNLRLREESALQRLQALESDPRLVESIAALGELEVIVDRRTDGWRGRGPARFFRSREDQLVRNLAALERPLLQQALSPRLNPSLRQLAGKLHIDPYTTHPLLRARLDRLAAAMAEDAAFSAQILELAQAPEQSEIEVDPRLWESSPEVLRQQGKEVLMSRGVAERAADRFLSNPYLSPTLVLHWLQTEALLSPDSMLMLGAAAESEAEVRMLITQLSWASGYRADADVVEHTNVQRQAPSFLTKSGRLLVLLPVEFLSWTAPFAEFAHRPDMLGSSKLIWITGKASPEAVEGLTKAGWSVRTEVEMPSWQAPVDLAP